MSTLFTKLAASIFAPTDIAGKPRQVVNGETQIWGTEVERAIQGAISSGALVYATRADLEADLNHDANTGAWVVADPNDANNGIYQKVGDAGTGSWARRSGLPQGEQGPPGIPGADGDITWQGPWQADTLYTANQAVENGGSSYVCIADHTSSASDEPGTGANWQANWDLMAAKGDKGDTGDKGDKGDKGDQGDTGPMGPGWNQWRGAWQTGTAYVVNDVVSNSGSSYICTSDHTSAAGTAPGTGASWQTVWDLVAARGQDGSGTGDMLASVYDPEGKQTNAFDSANHSYDNSTSGLEADTVQDALDELAEGAGGLALVDDRPALSDLDGNRPVAFLKEAGRQGIFQFDASDQSSLVTADTAQGVAVPPSSDGTGASGAYVRIDRDREIPAGWFGYDPGATNNAPALQAAVNYVKSVGGGTIVLPPGMANITSQVDIITCPNLRIKGAGGTRASVLRATASGFTILALSDASHDFELLDLQLRTATPNADTSVIGLSTNPLATVCSRPTIKNVDTDGLNTVFLNEAGGNLSMEDCYLARNWAYGVILGGGSDGAGGAVNVSENHIRRCRFGANASGTQTGAQIEVRSQGALRMWECDITGGTYNLRVSQTISGQIPANVFVSDSIFGGLTTADAVFLGTGVQNSLFRDCIIEVAGEDGIRIANEARNIDIFDCMIRQNSRHGVNVASITEHVAIKGCRITSSNAGSVNGDDIIINIVPSGSTVIVQNNHIGSKFTAGGGTERYGVNVANNMAGTSLIINNQFWGYGSSAINVSASIAGTVTQRDNDDLGSS